MSIFKKFTIPQSQELMQFYHGETDFITPKSKHKDLFYTRFKDQFIETLPTCVHEFAKNELFSACNFEISENDLKTICYLEAIERAQIISTKRVLFQNKKIPMLNKPGYILSPNTVKFQHFNNKNVSYIPENLIYHSLDDNYPSYATSNGMAASLNFDDALVSAFNELIERHLISLFFKEKIDSILKVSNSLIEEITPKNLLIKLKSLNINFQVFELRKSNIIMYFATDISNGQFFFNYGSSFCTKSTDMIVKALSELVQVNISDPKVLTLVQHNSYLIPMNHGLRKILYRLFNNVEITHNLSPSVETMTAIDSLFEEPMFHEFKTESNFSVVKCFDRNSLFLRRP